MKFIFNLTAREIRSSWRRLLFFFLCIAIGVGSIVALRSLIQNLNQAVGGDARELLTADLVVNSTNDFSPTDVEKIEAFIEDVLSLSVLVRSVPKNFKLIRDPKDEIIIDLAVKAEAEYIVSRDKDLLDLMTGFTDDCKEFRQRFKHLKIVEPFEFLRIVKEKELPLTELD